MADFIKKTSQAGGSKRKEQYIAHKKYDVKEDKKEDKKEEKKPESIYLQKKVKSKFIQRKKKEIKKEIKKEVKKEFITKKKKEPVIDLRVEFAHGSRPTGGGAAQRGLGRAFLKGGKV